jgi:hypothetical protein
MWKPPGKAHTSWRERGRTAPELEHSHPGARIKKLLINSELRLVQGKPRAGVRTQPVVWFLGPTYLLIMPIVTVPVQDQSPEPSAFIFPEQAPEPLAPLYFPVPLTIFHLFAAGLVMSMEAEPSYV